MLPYYSQTSPENATPSSTSLLASYKEVPAPVPLLISAKKKRLKVTEVHFVLTFIVSWWPISILPDCGIAAG